MVLFLPLKYLFFIKIVRKIIGIKRGLIADPHLQAENLEAKDANGFSDPYCMLGIRPKINPAVEGQVGRPSYTRTKRTTSEKLRILDLMHILVKHAPLSGESSISTDPDSSDVVEDSLQQVETEIDSGEVEVDLSTIY